MAIQRMIGRMIIRQLTGQNWDTGDIIREVRRAGYSYRRQDMLTDIRKFQGRIKYEDQILQRTPQDYVPKGFMVETDLKAPKKYRVHGYARYYNKDTGEYFDHRASFYTDSYQRMGDWEQDFTSYNWGAKYGENVQAQGFQVRAVEHNQRWPY